MLQVPSRAKVKNYDVEADVLATAATPPGLVPSPGYECYVLLFPDGEVKYYLRSAVEVTAWKAA